MIEKEISGRTCHSINRYNRYAEATDKYMNDYNKSKELSYFKEWDVKNMYRCAMSQKLPENVFKQVEDISEFDKSFLESYNEKCNKGYFFKFGI